MKRIISMIAAFIVAFSGIGLATQPVQATTVPIVAQAANEADCPPHDNSQAALCLYAYTNYQNMIDFWNSNEPRNTCFPIEQGESFRADSYYNNTRFRWRLFRTKQCDGSHMSALPFTGDRSLPDGWINAVVAVSRTSSTS